MEFWVFGFSVSGLELFFWVVRDQVLRVGLPVLGLVAISVPVPMCIHQCLLLSASIHLSIHLSFHPFFD